MLWEGWWGAQEKGQQREMGLPVEDFSDGIAAGMCGGVLREVSEKEGVRSVLRLEPTGLHRQVSGKV